MDCLRPLLFKLPSAVLPDLVGYINIFYNMLYSIRVQTISEYRTGGKLLFCEIFVSVL